MVAKSPLLKSVALLSLTIAVLVGCEETMPPPDRGPTVQDPDVGSYVGNYGATAGRTEINLEVTEDSFTAVTFTTPESTDPESGARASEESSVRRANADDGPTAVWVIFTGDVSTSGSTVTVTITGVQRDGQALEGAELAVYANCDISAPAGDTFDGEVMADLLECIGATDDDAVPVVYEQRRPPSELIIGTWEFERPTIFGPDRVPATLSIVVSPTQLRFDLVGVVDAEPYLYFIVDTSVDDTKVVVLAFREGMIYLDGNAIALDAGNHIEHKVYIAPGAVHYVIDSTGERIAFQGSYGAEAHANRRTET